MGGGDATADGGGWRVSALDLAAPTTDPLTVLDTLQELIVGPNHRAKPVVPTRQLTASSNFRGVSSQGSRWRARICIDKNEHTIGDYDTETAAAVAYDREAILNNKLKTLNFVYRGVNDRLVDGSETFQPAAAAAAALAAALPQAGAAAVGALPTPGLCATCRTGGDVSLSCSECSRCYHPRCVKELAMSAASAPAAAEWTCSVCLGGPASRAGGEAGLPPRYLKPAPAPRSRRSARPRQPRRDTLYDSGDSDSDVEPPLEEEEEDDDDFGAALASRAQAGSSSNSSSASEPRAAVKARSSSAAAAAGGGGGGRGRGRGGRGRWGGRRDVVVFGAAGDARGSSSAAGTGPEPADGRSSLASLLRGCDVEGAVPSESGGADSHAVSPENGGSSHGSDAECDGRGHGRQRLSNHLSWHPSAVAETATASMGAAAAVAGFAGGRGMLGAASLVLHECHPALLSRDAVAGAVAVTVHAAGGQRRSSSESGRGDRSAMVAALAGSSWLESVGLSGGNVAFAQPSGRSSSFAPVHAHASSYSGAVGPLSGDVTEGWYASTDASAAGTSDIQMVPASAATGRASSHSSSASSCGIASARTAASFFAIAGGSAASAARSTDFSRLLQSLGRADVRAALGADLARKTKAMIVGGGPHVHALLSAAFELYGELGDGADLADTCQHSWSVFVEAGRRYGIAVSATPSEASLVPLPHEVAGPPASFPPPSLLIVSPGLEMQQRPFLSPCGVDFGTLADAEDLMSLGSVPRTVRDAVAPFPHRGARHIVSQAAAAPDVGGSSCGVSCCQHPFAGRKRTFSECHDGSSGRSFSSSSTVAAEPVGRQPGYRKADDGAPDASCSTGVLQPPLPLVPLQARAPILPIELPGRTQQPLDQSVQRVTPVAAPVLGSQDSASSHSASAFLPPQSALRCVAPLPGSVAVATVPRIDQ